MPTRPSKNLKGVYVELPPELIESAKVFAEGRGESFREVVVEALRRHMAYPSPPPTPPPPPAPLAAPAPLPDVIGESEPVKLLKKKGGRK